MRIIIYIASVFSALTWLVSCDDDSRIYAKELKAEKLLMEDYIKRNGYRVVDEMPANEAFLQDEKLYYHSGSGLYYRLEKEGKGEDTISSDSKLRVGTKYLEYTLTEPADTADYWSPTVSQYWREFVYGGNTNSMALAFIEAVGYMKKTEAEAKLIVPSKLGFDPTGEVTPHGYKMKIRFTKNNIPEEDKQ